MSYNVPITFIIFNRIDVTKEVFSRIKDVKPKKLYLVSDGPRMEKIGENELVTEIREYILKNIDWDCEVKMNFSDFNMGCQKRVTSGISWTLENEDRTIILEDDCVPEPSFFEFMEYALEKYKDEAQVMMVSGNNIVTNYETDMDYIFTDFPSIWGWGTWKRAWDFLDAEMKEWPLRNTRRKILKNKRLLTKVFLIKHYNEAYKNKTDIWDYQWVYSMRIRGGCCVVPCQNLVSNIGLCRSDATHTTGGVDFMAEVGEIAKPYRSPNNIVCDSYYDVLYQKKVFGFKRAIDYLKRLF